jgi:serine/threonine protein kinase
MGVVYSAYDTILERKVAIKVVGDRVLADKTARDLLLEEARASSSLNHPIVPRVSEGNPGNSLIRLSVPDGI